MSIAIDLKSQKYDRQLRLWATTGQQALEGANICLLNVNSTSCEIIKNLVLPGVGHVTIVDDEKITKDDIRSNFFLGPDSTGLSKAKCAAELLQELNEDVVVDYVEKSPVQLIENDISFFEPFTMIIAVNLSDNYLPTIASFCHHFSKSLIIGKSKGLVGFFSIQSPQHRIIETHPENTTDLRLNCPFKQLSEYVERYDLDSLDQTDHSQVPFVVILLKYAEIWKSEHEGQLPQSYQQRQEFIKRLRADMRTPEEENFEEAIANVWRLAPTNNISSELRHIFEDPCCQNVNSNSPYFWILARTVRDFIDNEGQGQLPLSGKLPDMKSDTCNYIALQNVYREKALSDFNTIKERVKDFHVQIPDETIELFCKNASNIRVIQYKLLSENQLSPEKLINLFNNEENFCYYFVFKAADRFQSEYGYLPDSIEDYDKLEEQAQLLMEELGIMSKDIEERILKSDTFDKALVNYLHFSNLETPNLASLIGGLAAQEAIKMITHQYIPINNTCVFNGISSTSSVFEL